VLADFLAAAATPAPTLGTTHDSYSWWSDIWLPGLVGLGSVAAAAAAVLVAWRSNRVAQRATAAAERSNELAHQALAHERAQAKLTAERVEAEARAQFAERVNTRFEAFYLLQESESDSEREVVEISTLTFEAIANGWSDLDLSDWLEFSLRAVPTRSDKRREYFDDHRTALRTIMAVWVRNPEELRSDRDYFMESLRSNYPEVTD
jgi:hypothetical protein